MCLVTSHPKPIVAEENIEVYKVLFTLERFDSTVDNPKYMYYAPYHTGYKYRDGINYANGDRDVRSETTRRGGTVLETVHRVFGGFLHSCRTLDQAISTAKSILNTGVLGFAQKLVVVKMVIPKDSEMYDSIGGIYYCSDKLKWDSTQEPLFEIPIAQ